MMESDADRLASIKALGGQLVTHEDGEFWALFDNAFRAALDDMVETRGPALTCVATDVAALKRGTPLTVNGTAYKLQRLEPDESQGFTVIHLSR